MEFIEEIEVLGAKSRNLAGSLKTEEATKNALVMPFIQKLGYDVFNPNEVIPEFQAEAGVKKDQRVDYALMKNGVPIILIECKAYSEKLSEEHADQLKRYFPFVQTAKIGILTNGHHYKFYSDLEKDNVMDDLPYMEFDIENPSRDILPKLQELRKDQFDDEKAVRVAEQLKYTGQFKQILAKEMDSPSEEFVRLFASRVWSGKINQSAKEKLTPLLKDAFKQFVEDRISARLKKAAEDEEIEKAKALEEEEQEGFVEEDNGGVVTTTEEKQGFEFVRAIAARIIDPERIVIRDNKSYCAVLLDNSRKKTIVRLLFKKDSLKLDFQGCLKDDPQVDIEKTSDIYKYDSMVLEVIEGYLQPKKADKEKESE